ncbi:Ohr family peroxiredoxin [Enterococcus sp. DIV0691]|uniref:Ohr family peroxiredoxin n=1 Tax=Enterococcus sp. DIV0691 TaxID=2774703 RepID=UPI003F2377D2
MKKIYSTSIINKNGRSGSTFLPSGKKFMDIVSPGERLDQNISNPEQLFAAAYSACFNQAVKACLEKNNLMNKSEVKCTVDLFQLEDGTFTLGITLAINIVGLNEIESRDIIKEADRICPYSRALKGQVSIDINLIK